MISFNNNVLKYKSLKAKANVTETFVCVVGKGVEDPKRPVCAQVRARSQQRRDVS